LAQSPAGLLAQERIGVLATLSVRASGWPFASLVAYALTAHGEPLLLLSDLAEHTRNLQVDRRGSLLVHDTSVTGPEDSLAAARITLLGTVEPIATDTRTDARTRYLERHPGASDYMALADFRLYVLRVTEARPIGGFGAMAWLSGDALARILAPETT
jgi:putative heme iron utilization protein